jgi:hypothetical protein
MGVTMAFGSRLVLRCDTASSPARELFQFQLPPSQLSARRVLVV